MRHRKEKIQRKYYFDVIGDTVYSTGAIRPFNKLVKNVINKEKTKFVVHIGDTQNQFKAYPPPVSSLNAYGDPISYWDANGFMETRKDLFKIKHPLIITPGDNDWADTIASGNPDPIKTLEDFRKVLVVPKNTYFPFKVVSQPEEFPQFSQYVENKRWIIGNVVYVTIHTISGANGLTSPNQQIVDESVVRIQADLAWLRASFDLMHRKCLDGLVIMTQTSGASIDTQFQRTGNLGFDEIMTYLYDEAIGRSSNKQILYIYGDFHQPNMSWPFRKPICLNQPPVFDYIFREQPLSNFTAIEVPGWITLGRIRIEVDPCNKRNLFKVVTDTRSYPTEVLNPDLCIN